MISEEVKKLQEALASVRRRSVEATRRGDFKRVGKLTVMAGLINEQIIRAEQRAVSYAEYKTPP